MGCAASVQSVGHPTALPAENGSSDRNPAQVSSEVGSDVKTEGVQAKPNNKQQQAQEAPWHISTGAPADQDAAKCQERSIPEEPIAPVQHATSSDKLLDNSRVALTTCATSNVNEEAPECAVMVQAGGNTSDNKEPDNQMKEVAVPSTHGIKHETGMSKDYSVVPNGEAALTNETSPPVVHVPEDAAQHTTPLDTSHTGNSCEPCSTATTVPSTEMHNAPSAKDTTPPEKVTEQQDPRLVQFISQAKLKSCPLGHPFSAFLACSEVKQCSVCCKALPKNNHPRLTCGECDLHMCSSCSVADHNTSQPNPAAVCLAAMYGTLDGVLDGDAPVSKAIMKDGSTPLHHAARFGKTEAVQQLLQHGATVDAATNRNVSALHLAAAGGHGACVEALLAAGAALTCQEASSGRLAIHQAAANGHTQVCRLLLDASAASGAACTNATDSADDTPLHMAARGGHTEICQILLDLGAEVDPQNDQIRTPLHEAAKGGHAAVCQMLLEAGAAADGPCEKTELSNRKIQGVIVKRRTPLHEAAESGSAEAVQLLIDYGADVALLHDGKTALILAAEGGCVSVVKALLDAGCDVDQKGIDAVTALAVAAKRGHVEVVRALVESGAKVNKTNNYNCAAIHQAAMNGRAAVVKLLLEHGAKVNMPGLFGNTALHFAASKGSTETVQLLLDNGADITIVNCNSAGHTKTAADEAEDPALKAMLKARLEEALGPKPEAAILSHLENIQNGMQNISTVVTEVREGVRDIQDRTRQLADLPAQLQQQFQAVATRLESIQTLVVQVADKTCPTTFIIVPEPPKTNTEVLSSWFSGLVSVVTSPTPSSYKDVESSSLFKSLTTHRFRLKLICELTGEPKGQGYQIDAPQEWVTKLLPAMQVGMKVVSVLNGFATLAKCMYPIPTIPEAAMDQARQAVNSLGKKSTAADYACIQGALDDGDTGPQEQLGASLRAFHLFLKQNDPKDDWGGLVRYALPDGRVLWVSPESVPQ